MSVSDFSGYQIGSQMLNTVQMQMDVVGQNIANASTPGYSQEVANVTPSSPLYDTGTLEVGGGSEVTSIQRADDPYVDAQTIVTSGALGASTTLAAGLGQLQSLLNESGGTGISSDLNSLTSAFSSLSADPDESSLQQGVVDAASTVAGDINQQYSSLTQLQQQADQQVQQAVTQMNSLATSVAGLNTQIAAALAEGQSPNQLQDQQQQDLVQLGTLVGAQTSTMSNGMTNVSVNGHWLVDQGLAASVDAAQDPSNPNISDFTWSDNGETFTPGGGNAQGALELRDQDIGGAITNLNSLASAVMTDYNNLQASGYAPNSATPGGAAFFTGTSASNMQVSAALSANPTLVASAQNPDSPGDGSNAAAFAALGSQSSPELGQSYTSALANWTTEVGSSAALATQQQATQQAGLTQLNNLTSAVSGVNLNQQAIMLSQYEQAYQAGAKYIGTLDTMMQSLFMELAY